MSAYYNEFDPKAASWLRELIRAGLIADGIVDERSILDVEPADLRGFSQCHFFAGIGGWSYALRLAGWPDDRPVWTGSPPCQPFSSAGKGLGRDDARHLGPHFVRLVRAARPSVLFGEQVASAAVFGKSASGAGKAAARAPEWAWLDDLSDRLEAAHYAVGASDIPAAGVGAPHIRQRTFFGAVRLADASGSASKWDAGSIPRAKAPQHGARFAVDGFVPVGHQHGGANGGLADANGCGQPGSWLMGRSGNPEAREDREVSRVVNDGWCRRLADTSISGRGEERQVGGRLCARDEAQGRAAGLDAEREFGRMADAERQQREKRISRPREGNCSAGSWTAVEPSGFCSADWPSAPDSPWGVADWLYCRDAKWRPVEPGTFPLAHGLPARVGRLRGYGNAIVPQAAAEFIMAFVETVE